MTFAAIDDSLHPVVSIGGNRWDARCDSLSHPVASFGWTTVSVGSHDWVYSYMDKTVIQRFWKKVDVRTSKECWRWKGCITNVGYGFLSYRILGNRIQVGAHRLAYEILRGRIQKDMCIDHLCRNRRCCNPWHMEVVTLGENVLRGFAPSAINARKTYCKRGHKFDHENTYIYTRKTFNAKQRKCRRCRKCFHYYNLRYRSKLNPPNKR